MKVWVLVVHWAYEGGVDTVRAFSSREKAAGWYEEFKSNMTAHSGDMHEIFELEVDNP